MTEFLDCEKAEIDAVKKAMASHKDFMNWFGSSKAKYRYKKARMVDQDYRCCYCRRLVEFDNNIIWDLEHVLHEKDYPQFGAESGNLVMACKDCNGAKSSKDVYRPQPRPDPALDILPTSSANYAIPHPKIDNWDDYLVHVNFLIYKAKTENGAKGVELLKVCQLNRRAVERGGLDYDGLVAGIRATLITLGGTKIEVMPDDEVAAHGIGIQADFDLPKIVALKTRAREILQELEAAAKARSVDDAVAEAMGLLNLSKWKDSRTLQKPLGQLALPPPRADGDRTET